MEKDNYYDLKIILWLILFLVFGIIIIACKSQSGGYVMTVRGPVKPSEMGMSLTHEHILVDFIGADSTGYFRWNRDSVLEKALPIVIKAREKGVNTMIECTPAFLGRDPLLLKELSEKSGISFITNTGYYGSNKNLHIPESFYSLEPDGLAEIWINEFRNGIEATGIKPGFIKIAVERSDTLSPEHRKIITAAGLTHLKTGLVIASHTGPDKPAFEQIAILKEMGISPSAFIWVHAQNGTLEGNIKAAKEGTWISLDNIRSRQNLEPGAVSSISWYADRILELRNNGLLNRILLSHDSGWYDPAKPGGGTFNGFTDIFDSLLPVLKAKGMTDDEINRILVENPREAFTIRIRKL